MISQVALALGSNQGDRRRHLLAAIGQLSGVLDELETGPILETRPVSSVSQDNYLNTAVVGTCALEPAELLAVCKQIEHRAGRRRGTRWGPRPLDVDILVFGDRVIELAELTVPHPRLRQRAFYLEPLAQVAPDLQVPPDGATATELLAALKTGT